MNIADYDEKITTKKSTHTLETLLEQLGHAKTTTNIQQNQDEIIKIQSLMRGIMCRNKRLPNILYKIQQVLSENTIDICKTNEDGRVNSCTDEDEVIKVLLKEFGEKRIYKPRARMWYDILVYDYNYKWLPVNIKSTTTLTSDNTGNLAMCVYAYTDEELDLYKCYQNGKMSEILIEKLNKEEYNLKDKKDYYFVVVNKNNKNDIIINSVKGLTELTPNINNLPFQVLWSKNKKFVYKNIKTNIKLLINSLQKPKPSWKENFMSDIRRIKL